MSDIGIGNKKQKAFPAVYFVYHIWASFMLSTSLSGSLRH